MESTEETSQADGTLKRRSGGILVDKLIHFTVSSEAKNVNSDMPVPENAESKTTESSEDATQPEFAPGTCIQRFREVSKRQ